MTLNRYYQHDEMDGYCALKYSKQLNADTVLAIPSRQILDSDTGPLPKSATAIRTLLLEEIKHSTIHDQPSLYF